MIRKELKKGIRVLAQKNEYSLVFEKEDIILTQNEDVIRIEHNDHEFIVLFYVEGAEKELKIKKEYIFDVLVDLMTWKAGPRIEEKRGGVLNMEIWIETEGVRFANNVLEKIKFEFKNNKLKDGRFLGGNRFEVEYYKGHFLITDDLASFRSNVVDATPYLA